MTINAAKYFIRLAVKYRRHFLFTFHDLDFLLGPFGVLYTGVESGKRTLTLDLTEAIAKIYGLNYCKMIDPRQKIPAIDDLPSRTRKLALDRKTSGKKLRNKELVLPKHVMDIFESGELPEEFTSSAVWELLPREIKEQVKSIRITDLFKKGDIKDKVEETGGKQGREKIYRLK